MEWEWGLSPDRSPGVGHRVESCDKERSLTGALSHMITKEVDMVGKMIGSVCGVRIWG